MGLQKYIATILHFLLIVVQIILEMVISILSLTVGVMNYNRPDRSDRNDLGLKANFSNISPAFQSQKPTLFHELATNR